VQDTETIHRRRAEDVTESGGPPDVNDAWQRAGMAHKRIHELERRLDALERAFVRDDLGSPDTEGHRKAHLSLIEASKLMTGYKREATKNVIGWVVSAVLGLLSGGFLIYFQTHFKP